MSPSTGKSDYASLISHLLRPSGSGGVACSVVLALTRISAYVEEYREYPIKNRAKRSSRGYFRMAAPGRAPDATLQRDVLYRLTPRQQEVLQLAYRSEYFEMPRIQTGEELAAVLGIVPSTFAKHIRSAERNAIDVIFHTGQELEELEAN